MSNFTLWFACVIDRLIGHIIYCMMFSSSGIVLLWYNLTNKNYSAPNKSKATLMAWIGSTAVSSLPITHLPSPILHTASCVSFPGDPSSTIMFFLTQSATVFPHANSELAYVGYASGVIITLNTLCSQSNDMSPRPGNQGRTPIVKCGKLPNAASNVISLVASLWLNLCS